MVDPEYDFYIFPEYSEAHLIKGEVEAHRGKLVSPRGTYSNGQFRCWLITEEPSRHPEVLYVPADEWLEDYKRYNGDT